MLVEVSQQLIRSNKGTFVDCTLGGAGHARKIVETITPDSLLVVIDKDTEAMNLAKKVLEDFSQQVIFIQGDFANIDSILSQAGVDKVDGFLWDLGVSSIQIDKSERGFSYKLDGPLDMRMDTRDLLTAEKIVNNYSESQLTQIFRRYGEEKFSSRVAKFIVAQRKRHSLKTTEELVEVIKKAIPAKERRTGPHPAKRVFQAIRIEVNSELKGFEKSLNNSLKWLNKGGRLVPISYHSLEDRIVKKSFNNWEKGCICPPEIAVCVCGNKPKVKVITKKPIRPEEAEIEKNPRARSAKLRVAERV